MGTGRFPETPRAFPGGNRSGNPFPVGRASAAFGGKPNPAYMPPDLIGCGGFGPRYPLGRTPCISNETPAVLFDHFRRRFLRSPSPLYSFPATCAPGTVSGASAFTGGGNNTSSQEAARNPAGVQASAVSLARKDPKGISAPSSASHPKPKGFQASAVLTAKKGRQADFLRHSSDTHTESRCAAGNPRTPRRTGSCRRRAGRRAIRRCAA